MAIPSSGPLSMSMFDDEFGLGFSFNSYRGKGSVPASGAISFSQMYGATNIVRVPASGDYYDTNNQVSAVGRPQVSRVITWKWGGTSIYTGSNEAMTSYVYGSSTYYRGPLRSSAYQSTPNDDWYNYYYGIYRIGPP